MSSALTGKIETDVKIETSAQEFHDVYWKKPHHLPNMSNDKVHGCDLHDGEFGSVGSIVVWNFTHDEVTKMAKTVVEAVGPDKNSITYRVIEGDVMEYKTFVMHIQATPKSDGNGSIVHWIMEHEKLHPGIAHPESLLQFTVDVSKDIDAHLIANN